MSEMMLEELREQIKNEFVKKYVEDNPTLTLGAGAAGWEELLAEIDEVGGELVEELENTDFDELVDIHDDDQGEDGEEDDDIIDLSFLDGPPTDADLDEVIEEMIDGDDSKMAELAQKGTIEAEYTVPD